MPGSILGHIDEQKPLILVPSTDLGLQKIGADNQVLKFSCQIVIVSCNFSRWFECCTTDIKN